MGDSFIRYIMPIKVEVTKNLMWGGSLGLLFGVAYASLIVIMYGIGGSMEDRRTVDMFALTAFYVGSGVACGIIVGLLKPLGRWKAGTAFIGFIAAMPLYAGILFLKVSPSQGAGEAVAGAVVFGLVLGVPGAFILKRIFSR